jgi:hypothetical protein
MSQRRTDSPSRGVLSRVRVSLSVTRCKNNPQQLQCIGGTGQTNNRRNMEEIIKTFTTLFCIIIVDKYRGFHTIPLTPFCAIYFFCISVFFTLHSIVLLPHRTWFPPMPPHIPLCLNFKSKTRCFKVTAIIIQQCINISILLWQHVSFILDHLRASIQRYKVQPVHITYCEIPHNLQGVNNFIIFYVRVTVHRRFYVR